MPSMHGVSLTLMPEPTSAGRPGSFPAAANSLQPGLLPGLGSGSADDGADGAVAVWEDRVGVPGMAEPLSNSNREEGSALARAQQGVPGQLWCHARRGAREEGRMVG